MDYSQKLIKDMPPFTPQLSMEQDNSKYYSVIDGIKYRNSAVLVPLVEKSNGAEIILTIRSNDLPSHAGQICFPGGKVDIKDEIPVIPLTGNLLKKLAYLRSTSRGLGI